MIFENMWDVTFVFLFLFFFVILIFTVWILFRLSPDLRAKAGNLINRRKNYGIIDVKEKGRYISTKIVSMKDDLNEEEKRAFLAPTDPKYVYLRNGLPYVIYDYANGLIPYQLEPKLPEFSWNPQMVKAAIVSVKAIAQANAIREIADFIKKALIVIAVGVLIVIIIGLYLHNDITGAQADIIAHIPTVIKT